RREWLLAQEMACDELTLRVTQAPPAEYGAMLLRLAAGVQLPRELAHGALGVLTPGRALERRLELLKHPFVYSAGKIRAAAVLLCTLGLVGILPWKLTARPAEAAPSVRATTSAKRKGQPSAHGWRRVPARTAKQTRWRLATRPERRDAVIW